MVRPFWSPEEAPAFLKRTSTQYARLPFSTLNDRGIENRLFDNIVENLPDGVILAGGFMTALLQDEKTSKDIDFFFTSEKALKEMMELLNAPPEEAWAFKGYRLHNPEKTALNSLRFLSYVHEGERPPIQLIKLVWYESPEHVIDSFDLTLAQVAATNEALFLNPLAVFDIARKRIVLHRMQFPASTLRRVIKYTQKGYYACPGSLARIADEVAASIERDPSDNRKIVYVD